MTDVSPTGTTAGKLCANCRTNPVLPGSRYSALCSFCGPVMSLCLVWRFLVWALVGLSAIKYLAS